MSEMSEMAGRSGGSLLPVPAPEALARPIAIRPATAADFAWIDAMQKAESDKLGFLPAVAILKRIEERNVLVAEATRESNVESLKSKVGQVGDDAGLDESTLDVRPSTFDSPPAAPQPLGYCIAVDRYMKQDHVGQFIQLNVAPGSRRGLVGAALVKATFEKSAWGVKLFGLWCRQDLAANRFWEALGFVPLAFRVSGMSRWRGAKGAGAEGPSGEKGPRGRGGEGPSGDAGGGGGDHSAPGSLDPSAPDRKRVHIYWQKRVRAGDEGPGVGSGGTAYWFPYETQGGLMAESRVVLPIPPGKTWQEVEPVVLPGSAEREAEALRLEASADDAAAQAELAALRKAARVAKQRAADAAAGGSAVVHGVEVSKDRAAAEPTGFAAPPAVRAQREAEAKAQAAEAKKQAMLEAKRAARAAAKQARRKSDPRLLAFSRELRDRWAEAVAARPGLIGLGCDAKYVAQRVLESGDGVAVGGVGGQIGGGEVKRIERLRDAA